MATEHAVRVALERVSKRFGGVVALSDVTFVLYGGPKLPAAAPRSTA